LVQTVQKQADANREALGFLPKRVYLEAALQSKLFVAVDEGSRKYAGHLLSGGVFPRARIFQIFVPLPYRRRSVGRLLLRGFVSQMESAHYLSIRAQAAADLTQANAFWEKMGFAIVQTRPGGPSRKRILNIRVLDLITSSLFNFTNLIATGEAADLHLVERLSARSPVYVIDLNVLFDVTKRRVRAKEAGLVMNAGFRNLVRLAVSEEFVGELSRTSVPSPEDPILALALELPRLPSPPQSEKDAIVRRLAPLVFPERSARGALSSQDHSDLVHLATAIHHRAAGFVTGEKSILRARPSLQTTYGLDVVGVGEFAEMMRSPVSGSPVALRGRLLGVEVCAADLTDQNRASTEAFLAEMYVPQQQALDVLAGACLDARVRRVLLTAGEKTIVFGSWTLPRGPEPISEAFVCADQDHQATESAVEYLISRICRESARAAPALIRLHQMPGHSVTLRVAIAHGFRTTEGFGATESVLQKIAVGRPIDSSNWGSVRGQLQSLAGVQLPESMPGDALSDRIVVTSPSGKRVQTTLADLENLISPVLFLSGQRDGTVVPIRRKFAEALLDSRQFRLLGSHEAAFLEKKAYISSPRTASTIAEGCPLLFYESGQDRGQSAVVAVARALRVTMESKSSVASASRRRDVLGASDLARIGQNDKVTVTMFDNLMMLARPVSFPRLRQLGCVDGSNLVTARRLKAAQVIAILTEGKAGA
jgi:hypothetical protein